MVLFNAIAQKLGFLGGISPLSEEMNMKKPGFPQGRRPCRIMEWVVDPLKIKINNPNIHEIPKHPPKNIVASF